MKKVVLFLATMCFGLNYGQDQKIEITPKNSWFKAGLTAGVPTSDVKDFASFNFGVDVRAQYMFNNHFALGGVTGYNHFFAKDDFEDFGVVPIAGYARFYFQKEGVFVGTDLGVAFVTNVENNSKGVYFNPQIGYHNNDWNIYAYYQNTFTENINIRSLGVGATYNIRFK